MVDRISAQSLSKIRLIACVVIPRSSPWWQLKTPTYAVTSSCLGIPYNADMRKLLSYIIFLRALSSDSGRPKRKERLEA